MNTEKMNTEKMNTEKMNLRKFSDSTLDQELRRLASREREILRDILLHIAEVDRRKLFLTFAYANLFDYLTKGVGYSSGSAQRRIDAARLMREVPTLIEQIQTGSINLGQVNLLQKAIRQLQSSAGSPNAKMQQISADMKHQLLTRLENKSVAETETEIAKTFQISPKQACRIQHQRDESVRLEMTFSKDQWEKLVQMRQLLSNSLPSGGWEKVIEFVADKVIAQKTHTKTKSKAIEVLNSNKACQFTDSVSGRRCGSTWQLNVDHIKPKWAGGGDNVENLRILCANHNRFVYRQQANIRSV